MFEVQYDLITSENLSKYIRQVLDMEPLPKIKHPTGAWKFPRKRRRSNTDAEGETPNGKYGFIFRNT